MAEARSRENWAHTSALLAMAANCHRDPKKSKTFTPSDFNPVEAGKRREVIRSTDLGILKRVFVKESGVATPLAAQHRANGRRS